MARSRFIRRVRISASADEAFSWHSRQGAFERLSPPWESVDVVERSGSIRNGDRVLLQVKQGPVSVRWELEHEDFEDGRQFCDVQVSGPFTEWRHEHRFVPAGEECYLEDAIQFRLPGGPVGGVFAPLVRRKLERLFKYRHDVTQRDIAIHQGGKTMNVLVTGSTGLVGSALVPFLTTGGHEVRRLVRQEPQPGEVGWDPAEGSIDATGLEGLDAVVHLAGENIAEGRWTEAKKERIRDSRVEGTRILCEALAGLENPPKVLVCASAIGFYGDRGDEVLTEASPPGEGFLAEVCQAWEASTAEAEAAGIRVVHTRIGLVATPAGGFLQMLLPITTLGLGGWPGAGAGYMPWIALDDVLYAIHHAILDDELAGPVNLSAPAPATSKAFVKTLASVQNRPAVLRVPEGLLRLVGGELVRKEALKSVRMRPAALLDRGFRFATPDLRLALAHLTGHLDSHTL